LASQDFNGLEGISMTDDLIEAVARAIFEVHFADTSEAQKMKNNDWGRPSPLMDMVLNEARAAIRAVAPMILDMAADVVDDAEYAGFVRQLKERFQ
jgi:hypothetical protein